MTNTRKDTFPLTDGTVYSQRKNFLPFSTPPLEAYTSIVGEEKMERLHRTAHRLKGRRMLDLNATAQGGGVAEMLFSSVPFLNLLGIKAEWKVIRGNKEFFECTKTLHNMLQGRKGVFTPEMEQCYVDTIIDSANNNLIDYNPDVVLVHDPQPMGLAHYAEKARATWLWRCHIDIEETGIIANPNLWTFLADWTEHYNAAIFSAAHYIVTRWPLPKFIIPPFIDPLSEKNRGLSREEIDKVLDKYQIDSKIPIIAQIGRFDPWKGISRTIAAYRQVRREKKCQLVIAGGLASDDPEGVRVLANVQNLIKNDNDIHVLNLEMTNRLENWMEVNALQRAAKVIMQPSTKEGFGLVITEALWKGKPVIAADVGGIPIQIRDGDTGYFYQTPNETAQMVLYLLEHPNAARIMGEKGRRYVKEHFLLPDRMADYLMAVEMTLNGALKKETSTDCIVSFHPWFKLSKRGRD